MVGAGVLLSASISTPRTSVDPKFEKKSKSIPGIGLSSPTQSNPFLVQNENARTGTGSSTSAEPVYSLVSKKPASQLKTSGKTTSPQDHPADGADQPIYASIRRSFTRAPKKISTPDNDALGLVLLPDLPVYDMASLPLQPDLPFYDLTTKSADATEHLFDISSPTGQIDRFTAYGEPVALGMVVPSKFVYEQIVLRRPADSSAVFEASSTSAFLDSNEDESCF